MSTEAEVSDIYAGINAQFDAKVTPEFVIKFGQSLVHQTEEKMTKQFFEFVADVLRGLDLPTDTKATVISTFADELELHNPRFNRSLFIAKCVSADPNVHKELA